MERNHAAEKSQLLAFRAVIRMSFMVANQRDTDSVGQFAVKKVIGKPAQVRAAESRFCKMKSGGIGGCQFDEMPQLFLECVAEQWGYLVVPFERLGNVLLDGGMIGHVHFTSGGVLPRAARIRPREALEPC